MGGGGALVGLSSGCEILPMGTEWPPVTLALAYLLSLGATSPTAAFVVFFKLKLMKLTFLL